MRRIVPLCAVMLCALVIGLGCGDDETTTITRYDTVTVTDTLTEPVPMLVKGYAQLLPVSGLKISGQKTGFSTATPSEKVYPNFVADIYATEPIEPIVDSVLWADSLCDVYISHYATYGDPFTWAKYSNLGDSGVYASGDTVDYAFYAYDEVSTGRITLLDQLDDKVVMVDAATPDTLDLDSGFTVVWNDIPNAEWYGILMQYRHGGTGEVLNHETHAYTYDTTYTVPAGMTQYDGYVRIYVVSSTGPVRDAAVGNITGGAFTGTIYSYTAATLSLTYIGTGVPAVPPPAKGLPGVREEFPIDTPVDGRDIIDAITSR